MKSSRPHFIFCILFFSLYAAAGPAVSTPDTSGNAMSDTFISRIASEQSTLVKRRAELHARLKIPVLDNIQTGGRLAIAGTALYSIGEALMVYGVSDVATKLIQGQPVSGSSLTITMAGNMMTMIGPVFSCIGGSMAQRPFDLLYPDTYIRYNGWTDYRLSWAFLGGAAAINFVVYGLGVGKESNPLFYTAVSGVLIIASEAYRGMAAIGPLVYIKKAERLVGFRPDRIRIYPVLEDKKTGIVAAVKF